MNKNVRKIYHIINAAKHNAEAEKKKYLIKGYQRGYRWEIDQVFNLHNDIYINYKNGESLMFKIKILDCTLRDGGYVNNWDFGKDNIQKIIKNLTSAGIEFIECGFLSCPAETDKLCDVNYQKKIAVAVATAITLTY